MKSSRKPGNKNQSSKLKPSGLSITGSFISSSNLSETNQCQFCLKHLIDKAGDAPALTKEFITEIFKILFIDYEADENNINTKFAFMSVMQDTT